MKLFGALILLFAIDISQGHPLSKSKVLQEIAPTTSSNEPEKISLSEKEKPVLSEKPEPAENSSAESKPETVADLKPQSDMDEKPAAAPIPAEQSPCSSLDKNCATNPSEANFERKGDEYDQRQNGTENYRIQVDGLVFVVAPVEALLLAGGAASGADPDLLSGKPNITALLNATGLKSNNEHYSESSQFSPGFYAAPKPSEGPVSIKLINLIAPLLKERSHWGR